MAITLQEIVVKLEADIKQYKSALAEAAKTTDSKVGDIQSSFGGMRKSMNEAMDGMLSMRNLITGGVVGGIVLLGKNAFDTADAIGAMAQKTGVSTDMLQGLKFAASQSNVETESLNAGLQNFNRIIGEAATGQEGAIKAFKAIGVSITDANGGLKDTGTLLFEATDKFKNIGSSAEAAAKAQDLFGRSGKDMIPLLTQGADSLRGMQSQAQSLGLVMSADLIANADKTNDKIALMSQIFSTQLATSFIALGPAIQIALDGLILFSKYTKLAVDGWVHFLGMGDPTEFKNKVVKMNDAIGKTKTELQALALLPIHTAEDIKSIEIKTAKLRDQKNALSELFDQQNKENEKKKEEESNPKAPPPPVKTLEQKQAENAADLELLMQHNENMRMINEEFYAGDIERNKARIDAKMTEESLGATKYLAIRAKLIEDQKKKDKESGEQEAKTDKDLKADRMKALGTLASYQHGKQKEMAAVSKGAAIAQATIATYTAATEAYKAMAGIPFIGPALGIAAAAAAIASGLGQVSAISGVDTGFASGADMVPGVGTRDSVAAWVQPKERIVPRDTNMLLEQWLQYQKRNGFQGGGSSRIEISLKDDLVDFIDARLIERERVSIGMS